VRLVPFTTLMTRVRKRADIENAQDRFPDAEIIDELNEAIAELWDEVLRARGKPFYRLSTTLTGTGTATTFPLPAAFYQLVGVETVAPGGIVGYPLEEFTEVEHASLASSGALQMVGSIPYKYAARYGTGGGYVNTSGLSPGVDFLEILPTPSAGTVFTVYYVPNAPQFTGASGDQFDGFGGWEEYAVLEAAMRLCEKDADTEKAQTLGAKKEALRARIASMAPKRDRTSPSKVSDVRGARSIAFTRSTRWPR
jgi:hypothetical protein